MASGIGPRPPPPIDYGDYVYPLRSVRVNDAILRTTQPPLISIILIDVDVDDAIDIVSNTLESILRQPAYTERISEPFETD